jgi:hypothetical protein
MLPRLRARFMERYEEVEEPRMLSVAIQLPTGAVEVITNYENLDDKLDYYLNAYDVEFRLKANNEVRLIDFMLV